MQNSIDNKDKSLKALRDDLKSVRETNNHIPILHQKI